MKKVFFMGVLCVFSSAQAQNLAEKDSIPAIALEEVLVSAVRANRTLPVSFSNLSKKEIQQKNLGQQLPILVGGLPNVVSHSEDGSGVGMTYLSVRGSDMYRTNVTINGVPYNDAESQGAFWYNLSDFASSAENIQLQRGVGTSTNGAGAFGASLNVLTDAVSEKAFAEIGNFYGSYHTHKHILKFSTGKVSGVEVSGRFSKINTDGYRERASSDLKSYFLQGSFSDETTLIKALLFGGKEKTYLTYLGVDAQMLRANRRYNPAGKYTKNGKTYFYDNETDNYQQDHAQLHWVETWSKGWTTNLTLHYTKGDGYWEMYETWGASRVAQYGLENDFYGILGSASHRREKMELIFGGGLNAYKSTHQDSVIWEENSVTPHRFVEDEDNGYKNEGNLFAKLSWEFAPSWRFFVDGQYRSVKYESKKYQANDAFHFFNPKMGINYHFSPKSQAYFSFARATKEPNRSDYKNSFKNRNPKPKAEKLNDYELGWRFLSEKTTLNINAYFMDYKDQLVQTGKLNDKGYPIRTNSGESYRLGLEIDALFSFGSRWKWQPNLALSRNRNLNFKTLDASNNEVNWGNTRIAFSPEMVFGNTLSWEVISNFEVAMTNKYVSAQQLTNTDEVAAKIEAYFVNNLQFSYAFFPNKIAKKIACTLVANNFLNQTYVASGTFEDGVAYYFPQAEANFLAGITLSF